MKKIIILLILLCAIQSQPSHAFVPESKVQQFRIYNNGTPIGYHTLQYNETANGLTVIDIRIDMKASLLFVPVYSYKHTNTEVWDKDKLVGIQSQTNDNGNMYYVRADVTGDVLNVESTHANYGIPLGTLSTSYWHESIVQKETLINTQSGEVIALELVNQSEEPFYLKRSDISVPARRYTITGDLEADLWYHQDTGEWLGLQFEIKGNTLSYEKIPTEDINVNIHTERF